MAISTSLILKFNGSAVQKGLGKLSASVKKFGVGIMKVGGALVALGGAGLAGIVALGVKLNKIGEAANTSEARLASITSQMGLFGDEASKVSKRLTELADKQARMFGIDEKSIVLTQSKLMTFAELAKTADTVGGAFDRATLAAVDMAAAGFGSAEQNAVQLGKALNDPVRGINSLTRSGITFTAKQKSLIEALVETGKMADAQNIVLKAIETQVGGTAAATADASAMIKTSMSQLVTAFAKPFSTGFNSLPGSLESVFPALKEKAEAAGTVISSAISDAIAGDYNKLAAIGELIGEAIGGGIKIGVTRATMELGENVWKFAEKIDPARGMKKALGMGNVSDYIAGGKSSVTSGQAGDLAASLRDSARGLSSTGIVPNSGGRFRYAKDGETSTFSDANGRKVIELLTGINQKLAPQP
jgi:hypothetical protein